MFDENQPQMKGAMKKKSPIPIILIGALVVIAAAYMFLRGGSGGIGGLVPGSTIDVESFAAVQSEYVLHPEDLSVEYFFVPGGESPFHNKEVTEVLGQLHGKEYLKATGRFDGWDVGLGKRNQSDLGPATYRSNLQVFDSVKGAKQAMQLDWFWAADFDRQPDSVNDDNCGIGDDCILRTIQTVYVESNLTKMRYEVLFRYKNVVVWVSARGLSVETDADDALYAAEAVYARLKDSGY